MRDHAPLAQLDRVFDYESKGRGFESPRARQAKSLDLTERFKALFLHFRGLCQVVWLLFGYYCPLFCLFPGIVEDAFYGIRGVCILIATVNTEKKNNRNE